MSRTKILLCVIFMAILVLAELAYWCHHRVGNNAHKDFLSGILMVFLGLLGLLHCVCICHCVVDDDADNDHHHDHGTSSDDHVIITIKELAGVNPSVLLQSIPVVDFNSRNFGDAVECVVCLSELAEGDKAKVLPSCGHWFHAHCIDEWLQWHVTCPICRKRVSLFQINKPISELSRFSGLVETPALSTQ